MTMLAARGLGRPGGLLVTGGVGRRLFLVIGPDVEPFEIDIFDPRSLLRADLGTIELEDRLASIRSDRAAISFVDWRLAAVDPPAINATILSEIRLDLNAEERTY